MNPPSKIESGHQLFSRLVQKPPLKNLHPIIFNNQAPNYKDIIQITGDASTGKTLLATELLARCILPASYNKVQLPGNDAGAIIINTDHHFSVVKLITTMESLLKQTDLQASHSRVVVESSLRNLIVLNCYSSEQLLMTFMNLDQIISEHFNVSLVVVDSISAYYWSEQSVNNFSSLNLYCVKVLKELKAAVDGRNVVIVFTNWEADSHVGVLQNLLAYTVQLKIGLVANVFNHKNKESCSKVYQLERSNIV